MMIASPNASCLITNIRHVLLKHLRKGRRDNNRIADWTRLLFVSQPFQMTAKEIRSHMLTLDISHYYFTIVIAVFRLSVLLKSGKRKCKLRSLACSTPPKSHPCLEYFKDIVQHFGSRN